MKLSFKSFKIGDRIYYRFPNPAADAKIFLIGKVKRKGRNYVDVATDNNTKMRLEITYLENIYAVERII